MIKSVPPIIRRNAAGTAAISGLPVLQPGRDIYVGSRAIRAFDGRYAKPAAAFSGSQTWQMVFTGETEWDALAFGAATIDTASVDHYLVGYLNVLPRANMTDAEINALTGWQFLNWTENDGNGVHAKFSSFASSVSNPRHMYCSPVGMPSITRDDGGRFPVGCLRVMVAPTGTTSNPTLSGSIALNDNINHGVRPDGRIQAIKMGSGNGLISFSGAARNDFPFSSIIFYYRGKVVSVVKFGDSIDSGMATYQGDGLVRLSTMAKNVGTDQVIWECGNFAWPGASSTQSHNIAMTYLNDPAVPPGDILWTNCASVNDIPSGASAATAKAALAAAWTRFAYLLDRAKQRGIQVVTETIPAVSTSVYDWRSCDSERITHNARVLGLRSRGIFVLDRSVRDGLVVAGQVQPLAGTTDDGIHPNDAGYAMEKPYADAILANFNPK